MQDIPFVNTNPVQFEKPSVIKQFAAGMAHEIWNPLTVIKTMVFAMRADIPPEDPKCADFDIINKEIDRMERSIQQVLDYTWPSDPIFVPVRLGQIVTNAIDRLVRKAQSQGVQIETHVDLEVMILADQRQIEQVFVNLGLNALQAMPTGGKLSIEAKTEQVFVNLALNVLPATAAGAKLELAARDVKPGEKDAKTEPGRNGDKEPGKVGVEVGDTGKGIPEDLIDRIFEPFVVEGREGVGLSLAIVQQIVERHGGRIAAHNSPEGGATFTVILPRVENGGVKGAES